MVEQEDNSEVFTITETMETSSADMYHLMTVFGIKHKNFYPCGLILMEDLGIGLVLSKTCRRMTMNIIELIKHKNKNFLIFYYLC